MPALATSTSTGPVRLLDLGEGRVDRGGVGDVAPDVEGTLGGSPDAVRDGDLVAERRGTPRRWRGRYRGCRR